MTIRYPVLLNDGASNVGGFPRVRNAIERFQYVISRPQQSTTNVLIGGNNLGRTRIVYNTRENWVLAGQPELNEDRTISGWWSYDANAEFWPISQPFSVTPGNVPDPASNVRHQSIPGLYKPYYEYEYVNVGIDVLEASAQSHAGIRNQLLREWLRHTSNTNISPYSTNTGWVEPGPTAPVGVQTGWNSKWRYGGLRPQFNNRVRTNGLYIWMNPAHVTFPAHLTFTYFTSGVMSDLWMYSGNYATNKSAYPSAAATPDPRLAATTYQWYRGWIRDDYYQNTYGSTPPTIPEDCRPLYYSSSGELTEMTDAEIDENFLFPVLEKFTSTQPWVISTATGIGQYSRWDPRYYRADGIPPLVTDSTRIFTDTRANTAAYSTLLTGAPSNTTTNANFYLHGRNSFPYSLQYLQTLVVSNGIQAKRWDAVFEGWAERLLWYATRQNSPYYLALQHSPFTYNQATYTSTIAGTSETFYKYRHLGTVTDTRFNGSYRVTRFVGADDYRSQEWPSGGLSQNSYYSYVYRPNA